MNPPEKPVHTRTTENLRPLPRDPLCLSSLDSDSQETQRKTSPLVTPAGTFKRASAFWVDLILLNCLTVVFIQISVAAESLALGPPFSSGLFDTMMRLFDLYLRLGFILFISYFSYFTYYGGQTPGKMLFKIRVVTIQGRPLSLIRSFLRTLSYGLDLLTLGLGFILALLSPSRRVLHDYTVGTMVVRA